MARKKAGGLQDESDMYLIGPIYAGVMLVILAVVFGPVIAAIAIAIAASRRSSRPRAATPAQFSDDGMWWWNGSEWKRSLSEDGRWRWDGVSWQPVTQPEPQ